MSEKKEKENSKSTASKKTSENKKSSSSEIKEESTVLNQEATKAEETTEKSAVSTKAIAKDKPSSSEIKEESTVLNKETTKAKAEENAEKSAVSTKSIAKDKPSSSEIKEESTTVNKKTTKAEENTDKPDIPTETLVAEKLPEAVSENAGLSTEDSKKESLISEDSAEEEKDYSLLSEELLIAELQAIIKNKPIQDIKEEVEKIKNEFNLKFNKELDKNKEVFLAEGKNIIDFYYTTPLKKEFDSAYYGYKDKRNKYYKGLTKDLKANLSNRLELLEELKGLFNEKENTSTIFKHFKNIQERWFEAGAIPRDKYNTVWNNYHHHVENFYDILHLDREFRDRDFKQNLEQKLRLIGRAEELSLEENSNNAFRELQMLHKIWKEETGPVAKEYREEIWDRFSAATKLIHDKRHLYLEELEKKFEGNVEIKKELIEEINSLTKNVKPKHQDWQHVIKKVQELRDKFFNTGRVPRSSNKEIWNLFKEATRNFNKEKNNYYKNQKKEQFQNLDKKRELITIASENKDSDDFEVVTPLMKKIQNDWKNIGHVPRKDSDKIWKEFKTVCNYYFDRLHSKENEANKEEIEHLESKKKLLKSLSKLEFKGDHKEDLKIIKDKISAWKEIGRVPYNKQNIEFKFNKKLDGLFNKLDLSKKETELIKFENKLSSLVSQEDERKLRNEEFFLSKRVGESKDEIRQLENNLLFFKHVDDDNPLVKDVLKKINKQKEQLDVWKAKLKKIRKLRN